MGKKGGKKKDKITGTIEVQRFKATKEFALLKECVSIQESLPFVASDILDDASIRKVARFLNMIGLLAEFVRCDRSKEYRFKFHHPLALPSPQYFPMGYPAHLIKVARQIVGMTIVKYNDQEFDYNKITEGLPEQADQFLKSLDTSFTTLASYCENEWKADFPAGVKKFSAELGSRLGEFDDKWVQFETAYLEANYRINCEVFARPAKLVEIEKRLTAAEEKMNVLLKQEEENEFCAEIETLIRENWKFLFGPTVELSQKKFHPNALGLAEACVFYESKCTPEWLTQAKYVIKDYLELRIYIAEIPRTRLRPEARENTSFCRLLKKFHASILAAEPAFNFVQQLPNLSSTKQSNWMTRKLLEPDLRKLKAIATQQN